MKYLVFRLYGQMCSWGDIAVGETRPTFPYPTKSAVLGLVAGALGLRREEDEKHCLLADSLGFAVLVESAGGPLSDYHTTQVPSGHAKHCTRKDELSGARRDLNTILSTRDYRSDGVYTIVLWEKASSQWSLESVADALIQPVFMLYLGRKSCPLAVPLQPQVVSATTLVESVGKANFISLEEWGLKTNGNRALYWDDCSHSGIEQQHIFERRDVPLSRVRWQFDVRKEFHAALPDKEGA